MVPSDEECFAWWDAYEMPEHIRQHSMLAAEVATAIARMGEAAGLPVCVQTVRASTLLHDLAKFYVITSYSIHYTKLYEASCSPSPIPTTRP